MEAATVTHPVIFLSSHLGLLGSALPKKKLLKPVDRGSEEATVWGQPGKKNCNQGQKKKGGLGLS